MDVDVRDMELIPLLERVATETGWRVYVEPDPGFKTSAKFKNLQTGQALRRILGDLNFTLMPQTNGAPHLYVFRTVMRNATQQVRVTKKQAPKRVPNELILRVKPGTDVEALAKALGAKITGRLTDQNLYRFEFKDGAAADAAHGDLASNKDVADVDYNYYFDQPTPPIDLAATVTPPLSLQLKPPTGDGRVIIGLVDTAVQSLGPDLDKFIAKRLSVAGDSSLDSSTPLHGTSMAETALRSLQSATKGNTSVQILSVDVYGASGNATTWNVANGIVQAVNNGASVINLSLGGAGDSDTLRDLVQAVNAKGIGVVGAAGNEPVETPFFPAAYPGVIAVTAVDQGKIAPYANYGGFVDVAAPGRSVVYYGGQPWMVQGTSASAAYVSGVAAALLESSHQPWTQVHSAIQRSFPVPGR